MARGENGPWGKSPGGETARGESKSLAKQVTGEGKSLMGTIERTKTTAVTTAREVCCSDCKPSVGKATRSASRPSRHLLVVQVVPQASRFLVQVELGGYRK